MCLCLHSPFPMADEEEKQPLHADKIEHLDHITRELSKKLDNIHDQEFRKQCIQPILFILVACVLFLFYFYFPSGLIFIVIVCFFLSWMFPVLQVHMWLALLLLFFTGLKNMSHNLTFVVTPTTT